ncbi:hypothetical protein, partial [Pseudomonas syringae]|uniref:hypothetical protein n=1 Tax=Pseudomonas syringae TaxID=317 RepID=UPI0024E130D7
SALDAALRKSDAIRAELAKATTLDTQPRRRVKGYVSRGQGQSGLLLKRRSGSIRNTEEDHFNDDRFKKAIKWMKKDFFGKHIKNISIQRRLINCFLVPALGSQIVDLDAVILTPNGKVSCLEFKRKYPAIRMKVFGLDSHPHIKLINHLGNYSIGISHIILVPPDWDKNTSPLDMLKDTTGKELWHWLAVDLNRRRQKLSATPDQSGTVNLCHIMNSALKNASRSSLASSRA